MYFGKIILHIKPVSYQLPVRQRVLFQLSTVVYRSLAGTAPVYLADECSLVTATGSCSLRSADSQTCVVKRSRNLFSDRYFATAGPTLWNSLPEQLWQPDITFRLFMRSLKTFNVWLAEPRCLGTFTFSAPTTNILTYQTVNTTDLMIYDIKGCIRLASEHINADTENYKSTNECLTHNWKRAKVYNNSV